MILFGTVNQAAFDWPWSGIHFASGFFIGAVLVMLMKKNNPKRFWVMGLGLLLLWELVEITLRYLDVHAHDAIAPFKSSVAGFAFGQETVTNTTGDVFIGLAGMAINLVFFRRGEKK